MADESQVYGDDFNDRVLDAARRGAARERPAQWPRSATELRRLAAYDGQGVPRDDGAQAAAHALRRAPGRPGPPAAAQKRAP